MNRALLFTAAGILSAALIGAAGCEQDRSSESARVGSAQGETMHASGQPGTGARHGTGTTASGVTTGNATTGAPAAAGDASANSARPTGQAARPAAGPGSVNEEAPTASAAPAADGASVSVNTRDQGTPVGAGPGGVNESAVVTAEPAAAADKKEEKDHDHAEHADAWAKVKPSAAAPKDMQVSGTVKFAKAEHGVKVMVDLKGLQPNGKHGFHIHEKGDLSDPKLVSAGPHFNPEGKKHGGAEGDERHGGDLGNLTADDKGNCKTTIMAHGVTIDDEKTGIVGRSVIVHAKPDDLKSDPSGNSGDRIAGGAIEKPSKEDKKSADAGAAPEGAAQPAAAKTAEQGTVVGAGPGGVNETETKDAEELNK